MDKVLFQIRSQKNFPYLCTLSQDDHEGQTSSKQGIIKYGKSLNKEETKEIPNIMIKASPCTIVQQVLDQLRPADQSGGFRREISKKNTKLME